MCEYSEVKGSEGQIEVLLSGWFLLFFKNEKV